MVAMTNIRCKLDCKRRITMIGSNPAYTDYCWSYRACMVNAQEMSVAPITSCKFQEPTEDNLQEKEEQK